jgi:CheY-like chemotaxis protein
VLASQREQFAFEVLEASNGTEALGLLGADERVDALVTDLSMPEIDGLALIRAAQAKRPGLPAVLLTGYAGDGAALALTGAISGSYTLLRKPVTGEQLADRISALLESGSPGLRPASA